MQTTVSLLQKDLEEAVKEYVTDRVSPEYKYEFGDISVDFRVEDDGRVTCDVSAPVHLKQENPRNV